MLNLPEILKIFRKGYKPKEEEFRETWKSFWHKSEKFPISQIFGLKEEIAKVTTNFKGYHTSLADLLIAHPQNENKKDFFAWVGSPYPGTVYKVFADGGAWTDTGEVPTQQEIDLAEYAKKEDLTTKADKTDENGNKAVYLSKYVATNDITEYLKTFIKTGYLIDKATGLVKSSGGASAIYSVVFAKLDPNTTYSLSGLGITKSMLNEPILSFYSSDNIGASTRGYSLDVNTVNEEIIFTTDAVNIYLSFYIANPTNLWDWGFDSRDTLQVYNVQDGNEDDQSNKSLKSVTGETIIKDVNSLLFNRGSSSNITDITDYIKTFINTGYIINKNTGALAANNNFADIYTVVFAELKPNTTYSLSGLGMTQSILTEPILNFYSSNNIGAARGYSLDVNIANEEIIFTTDSANIYLSFYIANPNNANGWGWSFDSRDTLEVYKGGGKTEALTDASGNELIPKYNSLLYKKATYTENDITDTLKTYIKSAYLINRDTGLVTTHTNATNIYSILFVKLKPNTRYILSGLAITRDILGEAILSFYGGNVIGNSIRSYTLDVNKENEAIEFTTDAVNLYLSFYIANPTNLWDWGFDSRDTIKLIEYTPKYSIVDKEGRTITTAGGSNSINAFNIPDIDKGVPKHVCRIDMTGDISGISKDNAKRVTFKFNDFRGWIVEGLADLSIQGSTSTRYPKKNYAFDLLDMNGKSMDMKIGTWVSMDSYHLKANYIDATHARNIVCARLVEQTYLTRPFEEQRPWRRYFDAPDNDILTRYDSGALGHIDGFPVELYLNDEYYGLYTFNIKKARPNYQMKKDNNKHIHLEMSAQARIQSPVNWGAWEIRNPKGFTELAEPPAGEVKTAIESFFSWASSATVNTTKEEFAQHIHVPAWIDYRILMLVMDNADLNVRNSQLCTWDGQHWALLLYDLDMAFGMSWEGFPWRDPNSDTDTYENGQQIVKLFASVYSDEIQERYAYLRNCGVLTVDNIVKLFNDFMLTIGIDAYKKDYAKWTEIPSNRPDGNYPNLPNTGGYFVSIESVKDWVTQRFEYLDPIMGY